MAETGIEAEENIPFIQEVFYKRAAFHVPLLELATITSDTPAEEIDEWMCGASLYLRESAEDGGLLILSKRNLAPFLDITAHNTTNPQKGPL